MGERTGDKGEVLAGKILTAAAVALAAWLVFRFGVSGIFAMIMGANPANGVYLLFYGGYVVVAAVAGIGALAAWLLWRSLKKEAPQPGGQVQERSMLRAGLTMGLALVAGAAMLMLALFFWVLRSV